MRKVIRIVDVLAQNHKGSIEWSQDSNPGNLSMRPSKDIATLLTSILYCPVSSRRVAGSQGRPIQNVRNDSKNDSIKNCKIPHFHKSNEKLVELSKINCFRTLKKSTKDL